MKIKAVILDVDGVLTDGKKYYMRNEIVKSFSVRDGKGIDLAQKAGIIFCIITADKWPLIQRRARHLKIEDLFYDCHDKIKACKEFCNKHDISLDEVCFIGDDVNDIPLLEIVGLPATVGDGVTEVKELVRKRDGYICNDFGGNGAVRELTDMIRSSNG